MAIEEPTIEEDEVEEEQESSLRDDLENAIEEKSNELEPEAEVEEPEKEEEVEEEQPVKDKPAKKESGKPIGDAEGKPAPEGINAPLGFTPEAREAWKSVPDVVKAQINKRETEITEAVANTGEYRRTHTALTNLAQSYAPILAAEGAESPMAAVEGLFRTVAELRVGSPQQVAQKMADLIGHYGVDIKMLDGALSGQPVASPEEDRIAKMLEERLAPFQSMIQNQKQQGEVQQQQAAQAVQAELAEFAAKPEAEFLNDVRNDMADLIELASKQNRIMSFEEAYKKACAMHPEVSKVVEKRAADAALVSGKQKTTEKSNAASALRSNGASVAQGAGDQSLRGTINSIWDSYTE